MKINFATVVLGTILAATSSVGAAAVAHDTKPATGHSMDKMHAKDTGSMELHHIMSPAKPMAMPMTGNVEKDFASMMIMHHQQAIDMADVLLKSGTDPKLKAMAAKMKADQTKEIAELKKFQ